MEIDDVRVEGHEYYLSLSKIMERPIKDIYGYTSAEFGAPAFKICRIVFEDGTELGVEAEHDFPYPVLMTRDDPTNFGIKIDALDEQANG